MIDARWQGDPFLDALVHVTLRLILGHLGNAILIPLHILSLVVGVHLRILMLYAYPSFALPSCSLV